MKQIAFLFFTFFVTSHGGAASLTCVDPETTPKTEWSLSSDGVVSRGRVSVSQPVTTIRVGTVVETGEEKSIEFTEFVAYPFHGGCHIDSEGPLSKDVTTVFQCGLHGYGRGHFSPAGIDCTNNDWSNVQVTYDRDSDSIDWSIKYIFGTCREHGRTFHFDLRTESTIGATFKRDQCRFEP